MIVDSITLEVLRNAAIAVAEEMNADLIRTGYSPNIKERRDCSCALFDADGEMVSQAENMPVHLGAMPFSVAAAIEAFDGDFEPGDAVLLNDPFRGGAHLPDLTLVTPVFASEATASDRSSGERSEPRDGEAIASDRSSGERSEPRDGEAIASDRSSGERSEPRDGDLDGERLVAFAANRAHHADIGGSTAGSVAADSTEIYQEGLRIPPVKLFETGEIDPDILSMILANVRTPDERRGDIRAQAAANETARTRVHELVGKYGIETLAAAFEEIKEYSERRMRAEIEAFPDGTYSFADVLDDDGRGNQDLPVEATVEVADDTVRVDFAGTAPQTKGPVNAVRAVTTSATYYAIRCVTDPDIPPNHGCYRPITVDAPAGTIVNPEPPAAVVGGNLETSQRVTDVVLGAFAEEIPERVVAGCQGTMNNVTFGGTDPRNEEPYAFYETQAGGFGGRADMDGMDGVHVHMSNTMNTPVEVLETAYPLRVERYALRPDTGGAGEFRGGLGLRRDITVRDHTARFSLLADRHRHAPYGIAGGESGACGAVFVVAENGDTERIPAKSVHDLPAGTTVRIRTPGAGGYGDPTDRDPAAIDRDRRLGKTSSAFARRHYGIDPSEECDAE